MQARKEQAKAEAKERKQREREEQKQLAIAAEQEKRRQDEVRLMQEIEAANAMKQNLRQALDDVSFNLVDHDWSSGAPWVYECVEMGTLSFAWNEELSRIINRKAQEGWEYFRSESLVASRPAGCLGALFGGGPAFFNVVVLVFRRPAVIAKVERHYGVT
ncbi:MAG: hypothetical protein KDB00_22995 [Planctomycetales bacterium]|nr:hypothetical protein [Planctomycetales bacterium]